MDQQSEIEELRARIAAIEQRMPPKRPRLQRAVMDGPTFTMLRCAAGLSQRAAGAHLGVSGAAVHMMDHGVIQVDIVKARKIKRVVGRILRSIGEHSRTAEQNAALAICDQE